MISYIKLHNSAKNNYYFAELLKITLNYGMIIPSIEQEVQERTHGFNFERLRRTISYEAKKFQASGVPTS